MLIRDHMDQQTEAIDFREEVSSAAAPNISGNVRHSLFFLCTHCLG